MSEKNEKKEIEVEAPSKPVIPKEKQKEKLAERALEEERFGVLQISSKVGSYFGLSVLVVGVLSLSLFIYQRIVGKADWMILSFESSFLSIALWMFIGIVTTLGGLLLIGSD